MIPLRYPLNSEVLPLPTTTAFVSAVVTPKPTSAPDFPGLVVVIPIVWSVALSITQTFNVFDQVPGFLAPNTHPVSVV